MKRIAGILVLLFLLSCVLHAQTLAGLKSGVLYTNQELGYEFGGFHIDQTFSPITRPVISCFVEWLHAPYFVIRTELRYAEKGMQRTQDITGADGEVIQKLTARNVVQYLEIPILCRLRLTRTDLCPYIIGGISYNLSLNSKQHVSVSDVTRDGYTEFYAFEYKHLENNFSVPIGAGLEWQIHHAGQRMTIFGEFLYNPDITYGYNDSGLTLKGISYEFLIGVGLPLFQ